jgi:ABC-type transport system involved in cytochrome c biogenesis permease subunit
MTGNVRGDAMKLSAHAVVLAVVAGGLVTGRVLADWYHRARLMRVIAMLDPPAWLLYAAILLHVAPANPRRRNEVRSADGLVTSVRL